MGGVGGGGGGGWNSIERMNVPNKYSAWVMSETSLGIYASLKLHQ